MIPKWRALTNRSVCVIGILAAIIACASGVAMMIGINMEVITEFHETAAFAFIGAIVIHLMLHWRIILNLVKQCVSRPKRVVCDPIVLVLIIIAVLLTAGIMPDEAIAEGDDDDEGSSMVLGSIAVYSHVIAGMMALIAVIIHSTKIRARLRSS